MDRLPEPVRSNRIGSLEAEAADLRFKLERCVPPVDQHRSNLELVRAELEALRARSH